MSKTTEEKIDEIHEKMIRLEPICEKVEKHEKVLYNSGWGIVAQTKALWLLAGGIWAVALIYVKEVIVK